MPDEPTPGRPRGETVQVRLRIPIEVYDSYARAALAAGIPLTELLVEVLSVHEPRRFRASENATP